MTARNELEEGIRSVDSSIEELLSSLGDYDLDVDEKAIVYSNLDEALYYLRDSLVILKED